MDTIAVGALIESFFVGGRNFRGRNGGAISGKIYHDAQWHVCTRNVVQMSGVD